MQTPPPSKRGSIFPELTYSSKKQRNTTYGSVAVDADLKADSGSYYSSSCSDEDSDSVQDVFDLALVSRRLKRKRYRSPSVKSESSLSNTCCNLSFLQTFASSSADENRVRTDSPSLEKCLISLDSLLMIGQQDLERALRASYAEYDKRRVSLEKAKRKALQSALHYEKMDSPSDYEPREAALNLHGPQMWYLSTSGISVSRLQAASRIILHALSCYDSRRVDENQIIRESHQLEEWSQVVDSPVEHPKPNDDMVVFGSYRNGELQAYLPKKKCSAEFLRVATLVDYNRRRVCPDTFAVHARERELNSTQADQVAWCADEMLKDPLFATSMHAVLRAAVPGVTMEKIMIRMAMNAKGLQKRVKSEIERNKWSSEQQESLSKQFQDAQQAQRDAKQAEEGAKWRAVCAETRANVAESRVTVLQLQLKALSKGTSNGLHQGYTWEYESDGSWHSFSLDANSRVQECYVKHLQGNGDKIAFFNSGGVDRSIDFEQMKQTNLASSCTRKVRVRLDVPKGWSTSVRNLVTQAGVNTRPMYVKVTEYKIYDAVVQLMSTLAHADDACKSDGGTCSVMRQAWVKDVYRIENYALWLRYNHRVQCLREEHTKFNVQRKSVMLEGIGSTHLSSFETLAADMGESLREDVNEHLVMHGTSYDNADSIVRTGFDFRTCHRGMYGAGVYFASAPCKSNQYTCSKHKGPCTCRHERTMIIARAALGDAFYTKTTMDGRRRPPDRQNGHGTYDCIVANPGKIAGHHAGMQTHQEFVVFDMAQAYPAYVVQYRI